MGTRVCVWVSVLVLSAIYNRIPHTEQVAYRQQKLFLTVLEAGSQTTGTSTLGVCWGSFYKGTIPFMRAPSSWPNDLANVPHLQMTSCCRLSFNVWVWVGRAGVEAQSTQATFSKKTFYLKILFFWTSSLNYEVFGIKENHPQDHAFCVSQHCSLSMNGEAQPIMPIKCCQVWQVTWRD